MAGSTRTSPSPSPRASSCRTIHVRCCNWPEASRLSWEQYDRMKLEQQIHVTFRYAICFTRDVFAPGNDALLSEIHGSRPKVAVFLDSGLEQAEPRLRPRIERWLH